MIISYCKSTKNTSIVETVKTVSESTENEESYYILNTNTMKAHTSECKEVQMMSEENIVPYTGTAESLNKAGYMPCKKCNPW